MTLPVLSRCSDVVAMQGACAAFAAGQTRIHCGEAGLVLRLSVWDTRRGAAETLCCADREGLSKGRTSRFFPCCGSLARRYRSATMAQPGASTRSLVLQIQGGRLSLLSGLSSQFASSLILNAWDLPFPLHILCEKEPISEGYLDPSIDVAQRCGMQIERQYEADQMILIVPPWQRLVPAVLPARPMSARRLRWRRSRLSRELVTL